MHFKFNSVYVLINAVRTCRSLIRNPAGTNKSQIERSPTVHLIPYKPIYNQREIQLPITNGNH